MKIFLDKIASVVKNANLSQEVEISSEIEPREGDIIVVKVLEDKKTYNKLELISGRLSTIHKGDIVAVALGNRRALRGFIGEVPKQLKTGDIINILNIGGVAGICTSENVQEVGHALNVEFLGAVNDGNKNLNIKQFTLFDPIEKLEKKLPLIVVTGTCMNVGKTSAASEIIKHASRNKLKTYAAKLSGIAAMRDVESMKDVGAKKAVSFVDAGYTSTANCDAETVAVAKGAIQYLAEGKPDHIIIEFGDGIFGEYGVMATLKDSEIQENIVANIGCAHDPPGALKLAEVCESIGVPLSVLTGPVTDNSVGVNFIKNELGLDAFNAFTQSAALFDHINKTCLKK